VGADPAALVEAARTMIGRRGGWPNPFGAGDAGLRIVNLLLRS
jgi:hypothetical protein